MWRKFKCIFQPRRTKSGYGQQNPYQTGPKNNYNPTGPLPNDNAVESDHYGKGTL